MRWRWLNPLQHTWVAPGAAVLLAGLVATAGPLLAEETATPRTFGLVIGYNQADDPEVAPLRYADDDAIQNALLLRELGAHVLLLAQPDRETRELFPHMVSQPPTRANVQAAIELLNEHMESARQAGDATALYLFYTGHGGVESGEGYVHLQGGRLSRRALTELVRGSLADENHLVVDACKSYFMVFDRGAGGRRRPIRADSLAPADLLPDNVGVLLSTSTAADSHEWEALQAGVFSHEVRSALRGAADLNADGAITYQEAAAFIWSANASIPNRRYRPLFFAQAPRRARVAPILVTLPPGRGDRLAIGPGTSRHLYLEDSDGRRLADLHPGAGVRLALLLPSRRPLFLRHAQSDLEVPLPEGRRLVLAQLPTRRATTAERGAAHVAFNRLFERPFDETSLAGYRAQQTTAAQEEKPPSAPWIFPALGAAGIGVGLAGGGATLVALWEQQRAAPTLTGVDRQAVNDRIDLYNGAAMVCYAVGGVALTAAAVHIAWTLATAADPELEFVSEKQEPR